MSKQKIDTESRQFIHQRYQDTAVVIFQEQLRAARQALAPSLQNTKTAWDSDLTNGASSSASSSSTYLYSRYGNEAIIVHQEGKTVAKKDSGAVQSTVCVIM